MDLGPLAIDVAGYELTLLERDILAHPLVGAVVLFVRNYAEPLQLIHLVQQIKQVKSPELLVMVDQEGGRVQRFKHPLTPLPALASFGELFDAQPSLALEAAQQAAWVMASELLACGVDMSFAPVLDRVNPASKVIGDRGFHAKPAVIIELAQAYVAGMKKAGMVATGKHFPGHGSVIEDTHEGLVKDERTFSEIEKTDLQPFVALLDQLGAVMPAHVIYPQVDAHPASGSRIWLQGLLREKLGFQGMIFSDDLNMQGIIDIKLDPIGRVNYVLQAGCDVAIFCNQFQLVEVLLDKLTPPDNKRLSVHWESLRGRAQWNWKELNNNVSYKKIANAIGAHYA